MKKETEDMHLDEENESRDTLGDRMKQYEADSLSYDRSLDMLAVIRLDGMHFHSWVKQAGMKKPFDLRMTETMQKTTLDLCKQVSTCIMGYCQSDEITLVLKKGEKPESEPWFGNRVQKLCSASASICSVSFNEHMKDLSDEGDQFPRAYFDSRVIFFPSLDEVINCLIWRQNDCIKNSISSFAQSMFTQRELLNKNSDERVKMALELKGEDWNELPTVLKMGTLVHKKMVSGVHSCWCVKEGKFIDEKYTRGSFFIDEEIPRFSTNKDFLKDAYGFTSENIINN